MESQRHHPHLVYSFNCVTVFLHGERRRAVAERLGISLGRDWLGVLLGVELVLQVKTGKQADPQGQGAEGRIFGRAVFDAVLVGERGGPRAFHPEIAPSLRDRC